MEKGREKERRTFLSPSFRTVLFCPKEYEEVHVLHFFPFVFVSLESQSIHIVSSFDFLVSLSPHSPSSLSLSLSLFSPLEFSVSKTSNSLPIEFFHLSIERPFDFSIIDTSFLISFSFFLFLSSAHKKRNKNHNEKNRVHFDDWLGQRSSRCSSGSSSFFSSSFSSFYSFFFLFFYLSSFSLFFFLLKECPSGIVTEDAFKSIFAQYFPQGGECVTYKFFLALSLFFLLLSLFLSFPWTKFLSSSFCSTHIIFITFLSVLHSKHEYIHLNFIPLLLSFSFFPSFSPSFSFS